MGDVLIGRLLAPRVPPHLVPRHRLVERLALAMHGRVTTVIAAAGSGKSTLLAQALDASALPWVWLACDERLDAASLIAHLRAGIARQVPGFGARMGHAVPVPAQLTALCNEVAQTVPEELVIALDDVHTLPTDAREALGALTRDLPPDVHLVLAGRTRPPIPLARARLSGSAEIDAGQLAFDRDETTQLFARAGRELESAALERVLRETEGWVTGLVLAAQSPGEVDVSSLLGDERLFDFLAEEVLLAQPEELQRFLLATSVLERFTPAIAAAVSGREDSATVCADLVARNLFTVRLRGEDGWYRYHHLFAAFLRRRAGEAGGGGLTALHRAAARAWTHAGELREAVSHHLAAGDMRAAADALATLAESMLMTHESAQLRRWLAELPVPEVSTRPALAVAQAVLTFQEGEHHGAFAALEGVLADLIERGDHERAASAFFRLIFMQLAGGTPQRHALDVGARQVPRIAPDAAMLPACLVMLASELGCACRYEDASDALARIGTLSTPRVDPLGQAYVQSARAMFIDHPLGRSEKALETLAWAIDLFERLSEYDALGYVLALRAYRGIVLNHQGHFEEALAEGVRLREAADARGAPQAVERVVTKVRAVALAGLERHDELAAELAAAEPWPALNDTSYAFRTRAPAARLAVVRGDPKAVATLCEDALQGLADFGLSYDAPGWLCDLTACAAEIGLTPLARRLQEEAVRTGDRARGPWNRARAAIAGALAWEGEPQGDRWLDEALDRTDDGMRGIWTRRDRRLAARLLPRAIVAGLGPPGRACAIAVDCGAEVLDACADAALHGPPEARRCLLAAVGDRDPDVRDRLGAGPAETVRPRPPLRLSALGGFGVRRGDDALPPSAFGRERSRALLGAIACAGGPVHRDRLLEWLWPDLPLDRAVRAFGVTLHGLRRALEPELPRGAAGSVIELRGDAYRLALAPGDGFDVLDFLRLAREARPGESPVQRLSRLRAAERAYAGPLYPEWPYAEWAADRRAEVEAAYRSVEEQLALATEEAAPGEAVERYRRLVEREPEREGWHRGLMRAYAATGDVAPALRQYHACRAVLLRELGVEPGPETRALYRRLLVADGPPSTLEARPTVTVP